MEQQGLSEGSLRNSHREIHAVRMKHASASLHQRAKTLVESCFRDGIIHQRCDPERAEAALKKGTFYVMENEGRADPGFLIFLPQQPALFYKGNKKGGSTSVLRMRTHTALSENGGSILIATLDTVLHQLRLEDVWMWRGSVVVEKETFSKRREYLKEFVEHRWVPDARLLGGIFTTVANPISMEEFSKAKDFACASLEFIPEAVGRRRMWYSLTETATPSRNPAPAPATVPPVTPPSSGTQSQEPAPQPSQQERRVRATPVEKMPDVYDLFQEDGTPLSRASVQKFSLSQELRTKFSKPDSMVWVVAAWRPSFGGYEILRLTV